MKTVQNLLIVPYGIETENDSTNFNFKMNF